MPQSTTLDVNLLATLYFARIASVYLRQGRSEDDDKSLVLVSSVAGFKETSGMPVYLVRCHVMLICLSAVLKSTPRHQSTAF